MKQHIYVGRGFPGHWPVILQDGVGKRIVAVKATKRRAIEFMNAYADRVGRA